MTSTSCDSCGMPLESASAHSLGDPSIPYCTHCTDDSGRLHPFEERFERMTQWSMRRDGIERAPAEAKTREYMKGMPAWASHPSLQD